MQKIHYVNISLIKQAMREKEVTVKDLAKLTGYTRRTIKKYLNGADQKNASAIFFGKIAAALKISLDGLFYAQELILTD